MDAPNRSPDAALCTELVRGLFLGIIVYRLEDRDDADSLTLIFANAAASQIVGFDLEKCYGKRQVELFPAVPPERREKYATVARTGVGWRDENIFYSDARTPEIRYAIATVPLGGCAFAMVFEDVTAQRKLETARTAAEEALRQAHESLRQSHDELDQRVQERTAELALINQQLRAEIAERERAASALGRAEQQLRQAQKMEAVGRLAGGVAHDFNNMLVVMLSCAEFIAEQSDPARPALADRARIAEHAAEIQKDAAEIHENANEITTAAKRAAALTQQLLAFSRQQLVAPQLVDLNESISAIQPMLKRLIGEDIELSVKLAPSLSKVLADRGYLDQIVLNLAVNSRDAMTNGGRLTLETGMVNLDEQYAREHLGVRPGRHVMLAVSDTGHGIPPEVRERLFEPFFTTKPTGQGTGLGLSTVYGIVKQAGGSIWVYSEVGSGTTFKIYLPEAPNSAEPRPSLAPVEPARGHEEVILLVEDEDIVRRTTREILKRRGYSIIEARSAEEALLLSERWHGPIHAVVTDVVMPKMSGPTLVERLRTSRPALRALFMSGYTDDTVVERGMLHAEAQFVQKPFTPDTLAHRVRELLDAAGDRKR